MRSESNPPGIARDDRGSRDASAALARRYTQDALAYKKLWAPQLRRAAAQLLGALPLHDARRVLDVGCGVGALLDDLAAAAPAATVAGIDLSPGMLRFAPSRYGRAVMDATQMGFASGSFDVITMCFMLFHVGDPAAALRDAARVAQPGGWIGVITWADDPSYPALDAWTEEFESHGAAPLGPVATRHELVDTPDKVANLLRGAGFTPVRSWTSELNETLDIDAFIEARTQLGCCRRRFESLDAPTREVCLRRARARLERMPATDFSDRSSAVFVVASSPG
ncbi:MAG: class I SAM-dependent methyltransferase [Actinomycetota bacterium]